MTYATFYDTPLGRLGLAEQDGALTNVFFANTVVPTAYEERETPLLRAAYDQLSEYFRGERKTFDLPLAPRGTPFEVTVWQALSTIPYGEVRTYGQIAAQIGRPSASRAVGRANGRNPLSLFLPCHRVIGANGKLTGYAGGMDNKQLLLELEGAQ